MSTQLSWEEIVRRVTVEGHYPRIKRSSEAWHVVFDQIKDLQDLVRRLSDRSGTWKGLAAGEFRKYLREITDALQKTDDAHRRIKDGLNSCAGDLKIAVEAIPIPEWDQGRVVQAQQSYHSNADLPNLPPNTFWNSLAERYGGTWAEQSVESWFGNRTNEARQAYARLESAYNGILNGVPQGTDAPIRRLNPAARGPGAGSQPTKATPPVQNPTTAQLPANNQFGNPPPQTMPPLTDPNLGLTTPGDLGLAGVDPSTFQPSTGLAGATKPLDLASLGGGPGGGSSLGSVGKLPLGPLASLPPDLMTGGSIAGGSVAGRPGSQQSRLAAASGTGPAGVSGVGMMGGPMGGAPMAAQDTGGKDRRTGLQEDEDVFGPGEVTDWLVT